MSKTIENYHLDFQTDPFKITSDQCWWNQRETLNLLTKSFFEEETSDLSFLDEKRFFLETACKKEPFIEEGTSSNEKLICFEAVSTTSADSKPLSPKLHKGSLIFKFKNKKNRKNTKLNSMTLKKKLTKKLKKFQEDKIFSLSLSNSDLETKPTMPQNKNNKNLNSPLYFKFKFPINSSNILDLTTDFNKSLSKKTIHQIIKLSKLNKHSKNCNLVLLKICTDFKKTLCSLEEETILLKTKRKYVRKNISKKRV